MLLTLPTGLIWPFETSYSLTTKARALVDEIAEKQNQTLEAWTLVQVSTLEPFTMDFGREPTPPPGRSARSGAFGSAPGDPDGLLRTFHRLTRHGVLAAVPRASEDEIDYASRWFTHTGVHRAASWVIQAAQANAVPKSDHDAVARMRTQAHPVPPHELLLVAETFISLQERRHEADYNAAYLPEESETLEDVVAVHQTVGATELMWRAQRSPRQSQRTLYDSYHRFLQLALLKSGGPKTR